MELLDPSEAIMQNWLAALCVCSGRCVMAANGEAKSQEWNDKFTTSILEWLDVPKEDQRDFRNLPYGDSANDMLLVMLKRKRKDEEANLKNASLDMVNNPDNLYNGLIMTCIGATGTQLATLPAGEEDATAYNNSFKRDNSMLKPFEYDARSRAAAFAIGEWLDMPKQFVATYETIIAGELEHAAADSAKLGKASASALENDKKRKWGWRKYAATGAGVAIAGTLVGVTAGLAAPLLAAGMGAIGIGGVGFLATTGGAAMLGSLLGVAGGGLVGKRFNKRLRGVSEFYFTKMPNQQALAHSLHASIFVPGFLDEAATTSPFVSLTDMMGLDIGDAYTLYFETKELTSLKNAFSSFVSASAKSAALSVVLKHTILGGLIGSLTWPLAILKIGQVVDTPWVVGMERAKRAGVLLADVLANRAHGKRPVTLIGYSLGALVIFSTLQELHRRQVFGVVEMVVLLGLPANSTDKAAWEAASLTVSWRVVVGHSKNDWVLAFLYRASSLCSQLAGLTGVDKECIFGNTQPLAQRKLVNIDLSGFVMQHGDYEDRIDEIILKVSQLT